MAPPGPFLMPDGTTLAQALQAESVAGTATRRRHRGSTSTRGKDLQFAQVSSQYRKLAQAAANDAPGASAQPSAAELAELRALEAVGARRRRRWLNDRILRQLAGPMTAADIARQYQPAPFGWRAASALELIARPQHAAVWEGFRNIDADKEARVLQRWEAHNQEQAAAGRLAQGAAARRPCPAAAALRRWGAMSRKARAALRKANLHSVAALESQILAFLEAGGEAGPEQLCFSSIDSWGRLLVHGLADFHGLAAATTNAPRAKDAHGSEAAATLPEGEQPYMVLWRRQVEGGNEDEEASGDEARDITCSDVLGALATAPNTGSLSAAQLLGYMRTHVHGSQAPSQDDWVVL